MRKVTVTNNVTLDGVMQAPAGKDEDVRGGFQHGGRALPYDDEVKGKAMADGGDDLTILGSGELVRSLMRRNLVDRFLLLIHPLVLGSGQRLFDDGGAMAKFRLADSVPTTRGVIIATYELARS